MAAVVQSWHDVPAPVRDTVIEHVGNIVAAVPATAGQNCDLAHTLRRTGGLPPVFLKGVRGVSLRMRWLRNEAASSGLVSGLAPSVLFTADVDDWFLVGFEFVAGRPASFAPGSSDLDVVAAAVDRIAATPAQELRPLHDRWATGGWWGKAGAVAPGLVDGFDLDKLDEIADGAATAVHGHQLAHTDPHEHQFLIDDSGVHVIDWGRPAAAAPWVDAAFLVIRLIAAGHSPADAEQWARSLDCWRRVTTNDLVSFSAYVAGLWSYRSVTSPQPGSSRLARVAREYASWRLAVTAP